jgi:alkylation response protein AidB-like acyl-CoA dehydrogenase
VTIEPSWDHLGLRGSASHDVVLHEAFVPLEATSALAPPGAGHVSSGALAAWTLLVPSLYLGVARAARDWLARFLCERTPSNLGTSLAKLPRFESTVGEIEAHVVAAEELILGLAARYDAAPGDPGTADRAGLVKTLATRHLIEAVQLAVAAAGNPGLTRANPLQRHLRDVLCARVHTPQDDAVVTATGRRVLARFESGAGGTVR